MFTSVIALGVPFLIRLGEWATGTAGAPSPVDIVLFAACAGGLWLLVGARAPVPTAGPVSPASAPAPAPVALSSTQSIEGKQS